MAALIQLKGTKGLRTKVLAATKRKRLEMLRQRKEVVMTLVDELIKRIPVWTGRTLSSIRVSTSGRQARNTPPPPPSEWYLYGATNKMPLGNEPYRPPAEAKARAAAESGPYNSKSDIHVTINSTGWEIVNKGQAPGPNKIARSTAVVSEHAKLATIARYPGLRRR